MAASAIKKILVPLDGSDMADQILPYVTGLAQAIGASVTLFTTPAEGESTETAEAHLEAHASDLRNLGLGVATESTEGTPSTEIVEAARRYDASLIAMTGHATSQGRKDLIGSTAHNVMQKCTTPVLILPLSAADFAMPSAIVIGHDGSEAAKAALEPAAALAASLTCELLIVRAVEPVAGLSGAAKYYSAVDDFAEEDLDALAAELSKNGCNVTTHVGTRPPDIELVALADSRPGSIIAVSTTSLSSEIGVLGSTTDRLVRNQSHPVLAVPGRS